MASKVNRRRFLTSAAAGTAVGAAATVAVSAQGAESPPLPVPDAETKASADGTGPQAECCTPASKLIFACSGAADVGKIADLSARKLTEDGVGKMFCLAGVGGRVKRHHGNHQGGQSYPGHRRLPVALCSQHVGAGRIQEI